MARSLPEFLVFSRSSSQAHRRAPGCQRAGLPLRPRGRIVPTIGESRVWRNVVALASLGCSRGSRSSPTFRRPQPSDRVFGRDTRFSFRGNAITSRCSRSSHPSSTGEEHRRPALLRRGHTVEPLEAERMHAPHALGVALETRALPRLTRIRVLGRHRGQD